MIVERLANAVRLGVVEGVGFDVAGRTAGHPGAARRRLERLVAVCLRPRGDVLEAALGHAGGEEAELHVATAGDRLGRSLPRRPSALTAGGQNRVRDQRGAKPVGERRHSVRERNRSGLPRRSRPRTRRSNRRSPAGVRREERRRRAAGGERVAGSRRRILSSSRRPHQSVSGAPGRRRAPPRRRRARSTAGSCGLRRSG